MNQTTSPVDALSLAGAFIGNTLRLSFYAITHDEMLLALPTAWITNTNNETRTLVTTDMLKLADLPNYTLAAIPGFVIMCCVEYLVGLCRGVGGLGCSANNSCLSFSFLSRFILFFA